LVDNKKIISALSKGIAKMKQEQDASRDTEAMMVIDEQGEEFEKRQVPMFEEESVKSSVSQVEIESKTKRISRDPVWVISGTKKPNKMRLLLHETVFAGKGEGLTDNDALEACYKDKRFQNEIQSHPNEKVRMWSKEEFLESCKSRLRADGKMMIKKFNLGGIEGLPEFFPKSFMEKERKVDFMTQAFILAGGAKGKIK
jgi:hypothetical protein